MKGQVLNRRFWMVVLATCAALVGCAAPHQDLISTDKKLVSTETGLVVATLGYILPDERSLAIRARRAALVLYFRLADDPSAPELFIDTTGLHGRIDGGYKDWPTAVRTIGSQTRLLVGYSVKPGKYIITRQLVTLISIPGSYTATPPLAGPREFVVKPGEVTYLGAHIVETTGGKNLLGMTVPATAAVHVSDDFAGDREVLYALRPELKEAPVKNMFLR